MTPLARAVAEFARFDATLEQLKQRLEQSDTRLAELEPSLRGSALAAQTLVRIQRFEMGDHRVIVEKAIAGEALAEVRRRLAMFERSLALPSILTRLGAASVQLDEQVARAGELASSARIGDFGRRVRDAVGELQNELVAEQQRLDGARPPDLQPVVDALDADLQRAAKHRARESCAGAAPEIAEAVREARRAVDDLHGIPHAFALEHLASRRLRRIE